jgi:aminoglycoside 6'-N-acetyltransferase
MTLQPVLYGEATTLRPLGEQDVEWVLAILAEPEVRRWWGAYDAGRAWSESLEDPELVVFGIEVESQLVGLIQYGEEPDRDYRHASIDVFLHPGWHGRGLGSDALRTLAHHLFHDHGHHRLTIDPAVANAKAIACYKRVGFREVGVMRSYERDERGVWHDNLLMDMLAHEFGLG